MLLVILVYSHVIWNCVSGSFSAFCAVFGTDLFLICALCLGLCLCGDMHTCVLLYAYNMCSTYLSVWCGVWLVWKRKRIGALGSSSLSRTLKSTNDHRFIVLVNIPLPRFFYPTHVMLPITPLAIKTLVLTGYTHTS